jgi:hypothetical protein
MNWDKIEQLLKIAEATMKWPKLARIHQQSMKELEEHANKPIEEEKQPEPKRKV